MRPGHCISLDGLALDRLELKPGQVVIGAGCTLQRLTEDRRVPAPLKAAALQIVNRNIREMATLGGHIAARLPHSDLIPMLVALDAKVGLSWTGASKTLRVADYVAKPAPGLITRILVPRFRPGRVAACRNIRGSANARSIVTVAVSMTVARDVVGEPIVVLGGVTPRAVRLSAVERALDGRPLPAADELQALVSRFVRPSAAFAGRQEFLRHEAGAAVALALQAARNQKGRRR